LHLEATTEYICYCMLLQASEGATEGVEDGTVRVAAKKGESSQTAHKTSSLSCFGMPNVVDDEAVVEIIIHVRY
jgi:hypothetical protein